MVIVVLGTIPVSENLNWPLKGKLKESKLGYYLYLFLCYLHISISCVMLNIFTIEQETLWYRRKNMDFRSN